MVLREFLLKIGLDINAQSVAKGELAAHALEKAWDKVTEKITELGHRMVEFVEQTAEAGKEIIETAQSTGLTTKALQELRDVAGEAGISAQSLDVSFFRLSRSLKAAHDGSGAQAQAFQKLHVKTTGANGKLRDLDDTFMELADRFKGMPDGAEKTALAMELFGRQGARLIPILNKGRDGLAELRAEQHTMTDEQLQAGKELKESQYALGLVWRNTARAFIGPLLPAINRLVHRFLEWRKANAELIRQALDKWANRVAKAIDYLGEAFDFLVKNADAVKAVLGIGGLATVMIMFGDLSVATAARTLLAWVAALAPFLAIGAAIAAILLIYDDLRVYNEDQKRGQGETNSLWGRFMKRIDEMYKDKPKPPFLQHFIDFVDTLRNAGKWLDSFKRDYEELIDFISDNIEKIASAGQMAMALASGDTKGFLRASAEYQDVLQRNAPAVAKGNPGFKGFGNVGVVGRGVSQSLSSQGVMVSPFASDSPEYRAAGGSTQFTVQAPVSMVIQTQPGQSNEEIGNYVMKRMDDHWDQKMEEAGSGVLATP